MSDPYGQITITDAEYRNLLACREENETLRMCKLQARIDETKIVTEEWAETLAQTTVENERLKSEVERLRLRPYEREALEAVVGENASSGWGVLVLRRLLKRLEGGK